jgi:IS1 family transposase
MAYILAKEKQVAVVAALAEGSSIRSIERMTGINRNTIMNLGVRVGQGCAALLDGKMRGLKCNLLQFDEVWGFIGKKQKHLLPEDDPTKGDVWTFCAIDAETKLVPAFKVGKRDFATAHAFVNDVARRIENRPQISTDGLSVYADAIEDAFGANVDYGMIIKNYGVEIGEHHQERRYSAPAITFCEKREIAGHPDMDLVCTSHVERLNGITRLHMRRLTRLTHAFSKKLENFEAAVALHFAYYNLVRTHGSLKMTPAMFAGIERDFWSVADLVKAVS